MKLNNNEFINENENLNSPEQVLQSENFVESDLNKQAKEFVSPQENQSENGNQGALQNQNNQNSQNEEQRKTAKKLAEKSSAISGTIVTASSSLLVLIIFVVSGVFSNFTYNVNSITPYGTSINYDLTVEMDYTPENEFDFNPNNFDSGYILTVYNNEIGKQLRLTSFDPNIDCSHTEVKNGETYHITFNFKGKIDGLKEGTRYKVALIAYNGEKAKTVYNSTVKTTQKISEINEINGYCRCQIDGTYRFSLNYLDENELFSNFRYELTNLDGSEIISGNAYSGTMENPHEEQTIQKVNELAENEYILNVYFDSSDGQTTTQKKISINIKL